jgi:hypothetical protein
MYTLHQLAGAVPRRAPDNGQQQPWMSSHCAWWPFATLPHADAIVQVTLIITTKLLLIQSVPVPATTTTTTGDATGNAAAG